MAIAQKNGMSGARRPDLAIAEGKCPVCGGSQFRRFVADAYDIAGQKVDVVECTACENAWQWPIRSGDSVANMQNCHEAADGFWDPEEIASRTRLQAEFISRMLSPGSLLDIGGADGAFAVAAAKLGWDCTVIDPAFPAQRLSERVNIINGLVSDLPAAPLYDAATMWAMIEHVPDYVTLFADAFDKLRSGGKLVIETLNYQSLGRLRSGLTWWGFQIDHRWYLSPGAYRQALLDIGFRQVEIARTVLRTHWRGEQNQIRSPIAFAKDAIKRPWHAGAALSGFVAERGALRRWPDWATLPLQTIVATK